MTVFAAILLIALLGVAVGLFGLSVSILYNLAVGLVVGALARLVLPGEEKIGLLGTALIGMGGSMGGHVIGRALELGPMFQLGIGVAVAAGLLTVLGFRGR